MMKANIFSNKITSTLLCLLTSALGGSLFPIIKVGYSSFKISSTDIPTVILFAGLRFFVSGIVLILLSSIKQKKPDIPQKRDLKQILLGALFTIILHYSLTYIALSLGDSSKSAIIKQVGFLFMSCFAFLFDKEDKLSYKKIFAGIIGFCGIVATNSDTSGFNINAVDFILIASSFCYIFGSVVEKKSTKTIPSTRFVAYSHLFGGIFLCIMGLILGGKITYIDWEALLVFVYICFASISVYLTWNILLKYNSLSRLSVLKFADPLFAVILSGLILNENILRISYLVALILIFVAIIIINSKSKEIKQI